VLDAYHGASVLAARDGCRVPWTVLAGIGKVESDHARYTTATIRPDGEVVPWIIGPRLDGTGGTAAIGDSDGGRWDRDPVWDRAVGPMQFIPTSWRRFGQDGNGDDDADPHNLFDASAAAATHLCHAPPTAGGKDLADRAELRRALFAYNPSAAYVAHVLGWVDTYTATASASRAGTVGGYALPVARELLTPAMLTRSHHHYPAVDLPVPTGTPVSAVHDGRVLAVTAVASRCGLGVVIAGDDGATYTYCHASTIHTTAGARVTTGETIMRSGSTGNSTGPHLHLDIRTPDGARVCPQPLLHAWYQGRLAAPADAPTSGCIS
jgi:murein DD-endopeptidase MepM/ murein hydrolase activator NlpD